MEVPEKYKDAEQGGIDRGQLLDDLDQYLSDDRDDEQLVMGIAEELKRRVEDDEYFLRMVYKVVENEQSFMLDEAGELYGYGILNVNQNAFLTLTEYTRESTGYFENDHIVGSRDKLKKAFATMVAQEEESNSMNDFSHLRVVSVRLANSLDSQCTSLGDSVLEMAENLEAVDIEQVMEDE